MAKKGKSDEERADDARILKLFRGRCVGCMSVASEVHELITRARSRDALTLPQNRVPLCHSCHHRAHFNGYTQDKEEFLRNKAVELLVRFGESVETW